MSIDVKPGRWRMRSGETAVVIDRDGPFAWPWRGHLCSSNAAMSWSRGGLFAVGHSKWDLIEYLGPEEQTGGES